MLLVIKDNLFFYSINVSKQFLSDNLFICKLVSIVLQNHTRHYYLMELIVFLILLHVLYVAILLNVLYL